MRALAVLLSLLLSLVAGCAAATPERSLVLATTTSTQDSGLLDELLPAFTQETGWRVRTVAVGSGQAIELGRRGEADVLLVHSPAAEQEFVAEGTAADRRLVMHNDFVLVGPPADPAGLRGADGVAAVRAVAAAGALFVSRGDGSGTNAKETSLWERAGVVPGGEWYRSTGQGMGETLRVAGEKQAYTLSDRASFLAQRDTLALEVLCEGDPGLLNVYHVIPLTVRAGERVQEAGGVAFADWITGPGAQERIGAFGVAEFGQPLFVPDAGKDPAELGVG